MRLCFSQGDHEVEMKYNDKDNFALKIDNVTMTKKVTNYSRKYERCRQLKRVQMKMGN